MADDNETDNESTGNIHVFDTGGDGRPVVLIHGWPLSHTSWSEQIPVLKDAGYRVVSYDRRGFGKSDPGDAYDYDALTGDLDQVAQGPRPHRRHPRRLLDGRRRGGPLRRDVRRGPAAQRGLRGRGAAVPPEERRQPGRPAHRGRRPGDARRAGEGPRRVLRRLHDAVLQRRRRPRGCPRSSARRRSPSARLSDQDAALGLHGRLRRHRLPRRPREDHRADPGHPRRLPTASCRSRAPGKRTHEAVDGSELVVVEGGRTASTSATRTSSTARCSRSWRSKGEQPTDVIRSRPLATIRMTSARVPSRPRRRRRRRLEPGRGRPADEVALGPLGLRVAVDPGPELRVVAGLEQVRQLVHQHVVDHPRGHPLQPRGQPDRPVTRACRSPTGTRWLSTQRTDSGIASPPR